MGNTQFINNKKYDISVVNVMWPTDFHRLPFHSEFLDSKPFCACSSIKKQQNLIMNTCLISNLAKKLMPLLSECSLDVNVDTFVSIN